MNIHEQFRRSKKVTAMVDLIWQHLGDHERLDPRLPERMRDKGQAWRDAIADKAGVNTPSVLTWAATCGRIAEMVDAEIKHRELCADPPALLFRAVDRPELGPMGPEDVELCCECGHMSAAEYEDALSRFGHECLTCRGFRLVHGYTTSGRGYPAVLASVRGGGAVTALRTENDQVANTRSPSPPPQSAA